MIQKSILWLDSCLPRVLSPEPCPGGLILVRDPVVMATKPPVLPDCSPDEATPIVLSAVKSAELGPIEGDVDREIGFLLLPPVVPGTWSSSCERLTVSESSGGRWSFCRGTRVMVGIIHKGEVGKFHESPCIYLTRGQFGLTVQLLHKANKACHSLCSHNWKTE